MGALLPVIGLPRRQAQDSFDALEVQTHEERAVKPITVTARNATGESQDTALISAAPSGLQLPRYVQRQLLFSSSELGCPADSLTRPAHNGSIRFRCRFDMANGRE